MDPGKAQGAPSEQGDSGHGQGEHEQRGLSMLAFNEIGEILDESLIKSYPPKPCIESLRETIIEQSIKIENLEANVVLLESYINCI